MMDAPLIGDAAEFIRRDLASLAARCTALRTGDARADKLHRMLGEVLRDMDHEYCAEAAFVLSRWDRCAAEVNADPATRWAERNEQIRECAA